MVKENDPKSVSIDELRATTRSLSAWRLGFLGRLACKQTDRVLRREQRRSGQYVAAVTAENPPPSKRNRHG